MNALPAFRPSFTNTIAVYLTQKRDTLRNINAGKSAQVIPAIYVVLRDDGDTPKSDWRPAEPQIPALKGAEPAEV